MKCSIQFPCLAPVRLYEKRAAHAILSCMNGHHFVIGIPPESPPEPIKKKGGMNKGKVGKRWARLS